MARVSRYTICFGLMLLFVGHDSWGQGRFTVLKDDTTSVPGKVLQELLVAPDITKADLQNLLQARYEEVRRRSFTYQNHRINLINVGIYAYPSREHAAGGQNWIGMLFWASGGDRSPTISLRPEVGQVPTAPEERFGFSEAQRKDIFKRLVAAEDQAQAEANRRYPTDSEKQYTTYKELDYQNKQKLAQELGISVDQLLHMNIGSEGLKKNWPMPKPLY